MRTSATDLKTNFGTYLQKAITEPVIIEKNHRSMAVLVSYEEYERLSMIEDRYWAQRAIEAEKEGFLGPDESLKYLQAGIDVETRP